MKRERSPLEISMAFAEELFSLWKGMMIAIGVLLIISVVLLTEMFIDFIFNFPTWIYFGIGAPFVIVSLFFLRELFRLGKKVVKWEDNFRKFSYIFRFETYVPKGKTPQEKILNQLLGIVGEVGEWLGKFLRARRKIETFLNVKVSGKRDEHFFDVYVSQELLKDDKSKVAQETRSKLRKYGSIFVKRYDRKEPIDERDLNKLREEIQDVVSKTKSQINSIIVVSTSGFTKFAKAYIKKKESWVKKCPFDLVQEMPDGYTVVQIG